MDGVHKAEVRVSALAELGSRIEDRYEAAKFEVARAEGALQAALRIQKGVEALLAHVDKDIDEGVIDDLKVAKLVKQWVLRASAVCGSEAQAASVNSSVTKGRVQGLEDAVKVAKAHWTDAKTKLALVSQAVEDTPDGPLPEVPRSRPVGTHPKESVRVRRLREQASEQRDAASGTSAGASTTLAQGADGAVDSQPESTHASDT